MKHPIHIRKTKLSLGWILTILVTSGLGCRLHEPNCCPDPPTRTLGSVVDQINQQQEMNAEAAKFIIYMHEFEINEPADLPVDPANPLELQQEFRGYALTPAGQDHVRQIAEELRVLIETGADYADGEPTQVVVERSNTSKKLGTRHKYPVHPNPELDEVRRQMVIASLSRFGIQDADQYVVVAPAFPTGLNAREATRSYERSIQNRTRFGIGF